LTPLVYAELRRLARFHMSHEASEHTLQPTALINEAFMRILDIKQGHWPSRKHFFAAASQIMRRVLVDYARKKRSVKRGREFKRTPWDEAVELPVAATVGVTDVLAFDEALTRLEAHDARKARVLEAWFFSGQTMEEIAAAMDISETTVKRDLEFGKVWLLRELGSTQNHEQ